MLIEDVATPKEFYETDRLFTASYDPYMVTFSDLFSRTFHLKKDTKDGF